MQRSEVLKQLKNYISFEVLNSRSFDLDESTPLLEWGVLNSLEIVKILTFIQNQFNVQVPGEKVVAEHFKDINSITNLVLDLSREKSTQASKTTSF